MKKRVALFLCLNFYLVVFSLLYLLFTDFFTAVYCGVIACALLYLLYVCSIDDSCEDVAQILSLGFIFAGIIFFETNQTKAPFSFLLIITGALGVVLTFRFKKFYHLDDRLDKKMGKDEYKEKVIQGKKFDVYETFDPSDPRVCN